MIKTNLHPLNHTGRGSGAGDAATEMLTKLLNYYGFMPKLNYINWNRLLTTMNLNITQKRSYRWRTTDDESLLYDLCCSWIYNNTIFNYDGFSMTAYNRAYYLKDQEHWKALSRNYYYRNKEKIKEYRLKNKEKLREYDKQYSIKNKEKKRAYRLKTREHTRQWQRDYYAKNKQDIKIKRYYKAEARA